MIDDETISYYLNLDWTLVFGEDLDFNGNVYSYVEIKEFPSFAFCAKTRDLVLKHYKSQLKLVLQIMLEDGDKIPVPGEFEEEN